MNNYEILEVSQNASNEVIKAAYKSLMQRYHPDRNPGNPDAAKHASLVIQAYEMLSDPSRRAAYDIDLKRELAHLNHFRVNIGGTQIPKGAAGKGGASHWPAWAFIAVIILSGWYIFSPAKSTLTPEAELQELRASISGNQLTQNQIQAKINRIDEIFRQHPKIKQREKIEWEKERAVRTLPRFITNLVVRLKDPVNNPILTIPVMGVTVGTFDSEKFMLHIESNKEFISQKLAEKLSEADYAKLRSNEGEAYLKLLILETIGEITGANRHQDYPSTKSESPGRYGVIEIGLPVSYLIDTNAKAAF